SVDVLDLQPDHLAGAQAATIAETKQRADLEVVDDGEQSPRLVRAHHQRDLLGLADVIDLGGKIQSPQRHAKQEPQPGHDAVAAADAHTRLRKVELEPANVFGRRRVGRALQKRCESLAAQDAASLRVATELARVHVLNHALAQLTDSIRSHGQLLLGMRLTTPRSSRQGALPAIYDLHSVCHARWQAVRLRGLSRSDLVLWPPSRNGGMSAFASLSGDKRTS